MQHENPPSLSTMLKCAGRFCIIRLFSKYANVKITAFFHSQKIIIPIEITKRINHLSRRFHINTFVWDCIHVNMSIYKRKTVSVPRRGEIMRDETKMDVYTSGVTGAEYDAGMKQLMSNKEIIVPILQMTVPEFKTCSQEEILQCLDISSITKDDFVSDIPNVEKDLRLTKEDSELSSLVEKLVRFDIRFKIINPKLSTEKIRVNLHIDMEAQKSYRPSNPSYPILKRAVYYVARDLSSQLSTITQTTDYSKLEKCYSIWICAEDVPKKLQNTLTEYSFSKKDIIGVADEPEEDYELLTVIIIRLGKETEEKGIFDYLKGLFTGDIKRIQRYSHIEWSEPFQEEASKMTGFGDMIYERGIQQGRHEGMILGALMSGKTPEEVSKMLNLPLEEIKKVQEQQMTVNK